MQKPSHDFFFFFLLSDKLEKKENFFNLIKGIYILLNHINYWNIRIYSIKFRESVGYPVPLKIIYEHNFKKQILEMEGEDWNKTVEE